MNIFAQRLDAGVPPRDAAAGSGWRTSTTRTSPGLDQSMATGAVLALLVETSS